MPFFLTSRVNSSYHPIISAKRIDQPNRESEIYKNSVWPTPLRYKMLAREELRGNSKDHVNRNRNQNVLDCFHMATRKEQNHFYLSEESWLPTPQHSRTSCHSNQIFNHRRHFPFRSFKNCLKYDMIKIVQYFAVLFQCK